MPTAEQFAQLLAEDGRGVHALLWDDQQDLTHALLILRAGYGAERIYNLVVSADSAGIMALRELTDSRCATELAEETCDRPAIAKHLWLLFLPQAASVVLGPWLNGWRRPLSEPPGTVLIIRSADFDSFQRHAPDLTSFVGPRVYDTSMMLSIFSPQIAQRLEQYVPRDLEKVLKQLPGKPPTKEEIELWLAAQHPQRSDPPS